MAEVRTSGGSAPGGTFIATSMRVIKTEEGELSPITARIADEPDLFYIGPPEVLHASGTNVYGFFDRESPFGESLGEEERLLEAALHVLDDLQDAMCEGIREPWPNKGFAPVPSLRGEVIGKELRLWFEDARGDLLRLPAVLLG
jgi:hypothetical protein